MNKYREALMGKPSINADRCVFCGRPAASRHHVVPRSAGGFHGPTVTVCGSGNESGCHGLLHAKKLHLRWGAGEWEYLYTQEPTKEHKALEMEGWKPLTVWGAL